MTARIDMLTTGIRTALGGEMVTTTIEGRERDIGSYVADARKAVAVAIGFIALAGVAA